MVVFWGTLIGLARPARSAQHTWTDQRRGEWPTRRGIPALDFCHLTLTAPKPLPPEYPRELRSLGDHLRTKRLKRGLEQKQVAAIIGVNVNTIVGWEVGRAGPKVLYLPAILSFLGYDPFSGEMSLGKRLRAKRRSLGLTQKRLAHQIGIATSIVQKLEAGRETKDERVLRAVQKFLEGKDRSDQQLQEVTPGASFGWPCLPRRAGNNGERPALSPRSRFIRVVSPEVVTQVASAATF